MLIEKINQISKELRTSNQFYEVFSILWEEVRLFLNLWFNHTNQSETIEHIQEKNIDYHVQYIDKFKKAIRDYVENLKQLENLEGYLNFKISNF